MTHEQHAKKFIKDMYLHIYGVVGPKQEKEIDDFFRHLKEAVKKDIPRIEVRGGCSGPYA